MTANGIQGFGKSHGAITVVNAIPAGLGAAIGIDLEAMAQVKLTNNPIYKVNNIEHPNHPTSWTVRLLLDYYKLKRGAEIFIQSEIPSSKGLKSSSAVSIAAALATIDAIKKTPPENILLKLLVNASKKAGVTITGGLDDIAACLLGGLVITDNYSNKILIRRKVDEHTVVLKIPKFSIATNTVKFKPSESIRKVFTAIHELARFDEFTALTLNGILYSSLTQQNQYKISEILSRGCIAAGISGTGPALAIICHDEDVPRFLDAGCFDEEIVICKIINRG